MGYKRIDFVLGNIINRKELYGIIRLFEDEKNHLNLDGVFPQGQGQGQGQAIVKSYNFYSCMRKSIISKMLKQVKEFEDNVEKYGPGVDPSSDITEDDNKYPNNPIVESDNCDIYFEMEYYIKNEMKFYTFDGIEINYHPWACCLKHEREGDGVMGTSLFHIEESENSLSMKNISPGGDIIDMIISYVKENKDTINNRKTYISPLFNDKDNDLFSCEDDCPYCS